MRRVIIRLLLLCCLLTATSAVEEPVRADLLVGVASIAPGTTITVGVRLQVARGWHIPRRDPGLQTAPGVTIDWRLPRGFVVGPLRWPAPSRLMHGDRPAVGYVDDVILLAEVGVPYPLSGAGPYRIGAACAWTACGESVLLGDQSIECVLPAGAGETAQDALRLGAASARLPASVDPERLRVGSSVVSTGPPRGIDLVLAGDLAAQATGCFIDAPMSCNWVPVSDARAHCSLDDPQGAAGFPAIIITGERGEERAWVLEVPAAVPAP